MQNLIYAWWMVWRWDLELVYQDMVATASLQRQFCNSNLFVLLNFTINIWILMTLSCLVIIITEDTPSHAWKRYWPVPRCWLRLHWCKSPWRGCSWYFPLPLLVASICIVIGAVLFTSSWAYYFNKETRPLFVCVWGGGRGWTSPCPFC